MVFVHPLFLWALLGLGIPLIFHFLMRQKPRKQLFPALRFLQKGERAQNRSLKLRHFWILVLRLGILLWLVLLFARPVGYWGEGASGKEPASVVLVVDTSLRMDYRFENRSCLERAKEWGERIVASLPVGSEVAVVSTYPSPIGFLTDREEVARRIQNLTISAVARSVPETVSEVLPSLKKSRLSRKEVYLLTDGTSQAWKEEEKGWLARNLEGFVGGNFFLVDVGVEVPVNHRVTIPATQSFQPVEGILTLQTALTVADAMPHTLVLATMEENGEWQRRGEVTVQGKAGETIPVEFRVGGWDERRNQGRVERVGTDALEWDNRAYFTVDCTAARRILLVGKAPVEEMVLFVEQALSPLRFREEKRARFDCEREDYAAFSQRQDFSSFSAVWLLDPPPLEGEVWNRLQNEVNRGLGLGIFPGASAVPLGAFQSAELRQWFPGVLRMQARTPEGVFLVAETISHPILKVFSDLPISVPWQYFPVFRYWQMDSFLPGAQTIFSYSNGDAAVVEKTLGAGTILVMTTPPIPMKGEEWNFLPRGDSWGFVVLMHAMTNRLCAQEETFWNGTTRENWIFPLGKEVRNKYALKKVSDSQSISMSVVPDRQNHQLILPPLESPGNYRITAEGNPPFEQGFSVNISPDETDLSRRSREEMESFFPNHPLKIWRDANQWEQERFSSGGDWFHVLGTLLFLFLAAEN
ncbi:MAG: BatA and WFA domain-containing protein, partial [Planctomycetia bacterium]|nr:BatA and WFA domain-containing protein [Planctomycetia bacterium]